MYSGSSVPQTCCFQDENKRRGLTAQTSSSGSEADEGHGAGEHRSSRVLELVIYSSISFGADGFLQLLNLPSLLSAQIAESSDQVGTHFESEPLQHLPL